MILGKQRNGTNDLRNLDNLILDFVFSEEGSKILRANGLIPLSRPE